MKQIAHQFTNPTALVISAVAFFVTIAFAMANPSSGGFGRPGPEDLGQGL